MVGNPASLRGLRRVAAAALVIVCLVASGLVAGPQASAAGPRDEAPEWVADAVRDGGAEVLVSIDPGFAGARLGQAGFELPDEMRLTARFSALSTVAVWVDDERALDRLVRLPWVDTVSVGSIHATTAVDESIAIVGADRTHRNGFLGEGVTVAVVDSGIERTHPDLASSVTYEACFILDTSTGVGSCPGGTSALLGPGAAPDRSDGHGTWMAGAITGDGIVAPRGIAPAADIEAYKIFAGGVESGWLTDVMRVLEHIAAERPAVDVVNMSFGFTIGQSPTECDDVFPALRQAVDVLRSRGVVVVAAVGNQGGPNETAPACLSNVVGVAATVDDVNEPTFGQVAPDSNLSTVTDVGAPGTSVETSGLGGGAVVVRGSSIASATVAGCAALLDEAGFSTAAAIEGRLTTSPVTATRPGGSVIPRLDCVVGGLFPGNVNCDGVRDLLDALLISQWVVGLRQPATACPMSTSAIRLEAADVTNDGRVDLLDSLRIVQCDVGLVVGARCR